MAAMKPYSALWFPVFVAVMIQALFVLRGVAPVLDGGLYGPDAYMRLVRVTELAESGRWFNAVSLRSNAPYGEALHWTRPLDVLLLAGAAPLIPFLGFRGALHWWGVLLSPVLQLAALAALFWAGRLFFDRRGRIYLGVIFLCQPGVFYAFMAGRPDHHGLLALLFVLSVGFTLRLIRYDLRSRDCLGAGAAAALAVWVSVEALLAAMLMLVALGLFWIWRRGDYAEKSRLVALTLAAGTALALALDPPAPGVMAQAYDRLSVVHVELFALAALFWVAAAALVRRAPVAGGAPGRLAVALAGTALIVALIWLLFPKFFGGPFVDVDPRVLPIWLNLVEEVQPLVADGGSWFKEVMFWLGAAALGLPYLTYRCLEGEPEERRLWLYLSAGLLLFVPLTFYQLRWATYAGLLLTFPLTGLLIQILEFLNRRLALPWRPLARALAVLVFSVGFLFVGTLLKRESEQFAMAESLQAEGRKCSIKRLAEFADGRAEGGRAPERILANVFFGPELLYRTRHEVISTPYHRNASGIRDAHAIMTAVDDEAARELIREREITSILLCPKSREPVLYRRPDPLPTFYGRLARGEPPAWLQAVALPRDLEGFRLFEVGD